MKTIATRLFLSGAILALAAGTMTAQNPNTYQSVGPALEGSVPASELPENAQAFIKKNFPHAAVVSCTRDYSDGQFDVDLEEGTDLEFNHKGEWVEVEAGTMRRLSAVLVKQLIPEKAYKELERRNMTTEVESIKRSRDGYKVELREVKYDDFRFANDGRMLSNND